MEEALPTRFGKYTLIKKLAMGGMAELFLALHRSVAGFEKLIVIKRILPALSEDSSFVEMFLAEARIAATLNHPNIVQIFDVGAIGDRYFIAMEYIHGEDLRSIVRAMRKRGTTEFPLEHALAIGIAMAAGLAHAHECKSFEGEPLGIVHRDISPQNIVVTFTGDVKVVDFGIAKTGAMKDEGSGQLKGKLPYMSPEQCRGENLDARSDVFSAGIILYELTTSRRLFRSPSEPQTMRLILEEDYPRPTSVRPGYPPALEAIVVKALARDPERRYRSSRALLDELENFVREEKIRVGASGLAAFMESLFQEKLEAQSEALRAGRKLAEVIAAQEEERASSPGEGRSSEHLLLSDADIADPGTPATRAESPLAKAAARQGPETRAWLRTTRARGVRRAVIAGVAALIVLACIGGILAFSRHGRTDPSRSSRAGGSILLSSEPPGAAIKLNGEITPWRTPHKLTGLPLGTRYNLKLVMDGFDPWSRSLTLTRARPAEVLQATLRQTSAASLAVVKVETSPPGATLILDGAETGLKSPATLTGISPGVRHVLLIQLAGHRDKQVPLSLEATQVAELRFELEREPLRDDETLLVLRTEPVDAELIVGSTTHREGSPYEIRIPAGRDVSIAVTKTGFEPHRREVRGTGGQTLTLSISLERPHRDQGHARPPPPAAVGTGHLVLDARPWCNVSIDGAPRGQTPIVNLALPAGNHTGRCVNPQFDLGESFSFTIRAGETTRKRLSFAQGN